MAPVFGFRVAKTGNVPGGWTRVLLIIYVGGESMKGSNLRRRADEKKKGTEPMKVVFRIFREYK